MSERYTQMRDALTIREDSEDSDEDIDEDSEDDDEDSEDTPVITTPY